MWPGNQNLSQLLFFIVLLEFEGTTILNLANTKWSPKPSLGQIVSLEELKLNTTTILQRNKSFFLLETVANS